MLKYFVYILQSSNGKYYTGYTTDLERRMKEHQSGSGSKFIRGFGFKKLLHAEQHATKSSAMKREAAIKKLSRTEKKSLIKVSLNSAL